MASEPQIETFQPLPSSKMGRPKSVTPEFAARIGNRVGKGLPLQYALALESEWVEPDAFTRQLARPSLKRSYVREVAAVIADDIETIRGGDTKECRRFPGIAFLLERRKGEDFGKAPDTVNQTNIQINGASRDLVSGIRDLAKRQIQRKSKPAQVLDVQAEKVS